MVSERFATEIGLGAGALGHEVFRQPRKIVGVVRGMEYGSTNDPNGSPSEVFIPSSTPGGFFSTFVARVDGRAEGRLAMIRDAIQSVDPQVPVFGAKTMEQRLDDALAQPRFYRTAVLCFAAFAVLLAVIGIYGIVSYAVAQRAREMGIRMALGTTPAQLRAGLLRQGLLTIGAGAVPGIAGGVLSGRMLAHLVDGAKAADIATYAATVVFIGWIAAMGIWVATRPVARLNIVEILRAE